MREKKEGRGGRMRGYGEGEREGRESGGDKGGWESEKRE